MIDSIKAALLRKPEEVILINSANDKPNFKCLGPLSSTATDILCDIVNDHIWSNGSLHLRYEGNSNYFYLGILNTPKVITSEENQLREFLYCKKSYKINQLIDLHPCFSPTWVLDEEIEFLSGYFYRRVNGKIVVELKISTSWIKGLQRLKYPTGSMFDRFRVIDIQSDHITLSGYFFSKNLRVERITFKLKLKDNKYLTKYVLI